MTPLNRKLLRDLREMAGQSLAIALVMGCGVAVLVMSVGTHRHLQQTRDTYYDRSRFADLFVHLVRAPASLKQQLSEIPGVGTVDIRIEQEVTLDVPGLEEPAIGRLVSLGPGIELALNLPHITVGRFPDPDHSGEVLVNEAFATANRLQLGDSLDAIINGSFQRLTIVGIALSPEYIFLIRGGDILPDDRRYGVIWMNAGELAAAFDMQGSFNSASLRLLHGASAPEVISQVDNLLEPYGSSGAYDRDQQTSARFISDELKQLRAMAYVAPTIFFGVACFLLNVVLSRTIAIQRGQIAALKAFGYYHHEITWHFVKFVLVISVTGCGLGLIAGDQLARSTARMYSQFYHFPDFHYHADWRVNSFASGLSLAAAVLAALPPVWSGVSIPPAAAMRPPAPPHYGRIWGDNLLLKAMFSASFRAVLRELQRRPGKSLLSAMGIACAVAVLILGNFGVDALEELIEFQFYRTQRHDVSVAFVTPLSTRAESELQQLTGVMAAETFRGVPVRLRSGHLEHRGSILGLDRTDGLYRLLDAQDQQVDLPPAGLALGDKLAALLAVRPGDELLVEVLDGKRQRLQLPVTAVFKEYAGTNAYMRRDALHAALGEGRTVSGGFLTVDLQLLPALYRQLKQTPQVASVSVKRAAIESFRKTIAENQLRMQSFNIIFACIIAWGVVYNTAIISLAERSRELATLRVIGFTRQETFSILLGELSCLVLLALPLGYALGYGFCWSMVRAFESEMFRIPLVITGKTMAFAAVTTFAAAFVSALVVRRRVDELDLVGVLKGAE
jgi:putative ABC transport system permease protein